VGEFRDGGEGDASPGVNALTTHPVGEKEGKREKKRGRGEENDIGR